MTLTSVPVAMLSHYCAFMAVWVALVPSGPHPPRYPELGCFCPGFVAALIVALWMGHPHRRDLRHKRRAADTIKSTRDILLWATAKRNSSDEKLININTCACACR